MAIVDETVSDYSFEVDKACSILMQVYDSIMQSDDEVSNDVNITCLLFCIEQC